MKFKWRKREKLSSPIHARKGDTFELHHRQQLFEKGELKQTVQRRVLQEKIKKDIRIDEVGIFEVKDWEGFEDGIGGIFGVRG